MSQIIRPANLAVAEGWGTLTAEIFYGFPDFPHILQTFIWQKYDLAPEFPELYSFLDMWEKKIEGPLHSVKFVHARLISETEIQVLRGNLKLN